jgi:hypothetical protein
LKAVNAKNPGDEFWRFSYCFPIGVVIVSFFLKGKTDVWQGILPLIVLETLERNDSLQGCGIVRQIVQTSADLLSVNYWTLYPTLLNPNRPDAGRPVTNE